MGTDHDLTVTMDVHNAYDAIFVAGKRLTIAASTANKREQLRPQKLHYPRLGNGNDELAAAIAVGGLLPENLVGEIPREQEREVGLVFEEFLGGKNGQVIAAHVAALLGKTREN